MLEAELEATVVAAGFEAGALPTTCSPQAWSAAAPLALLRTLAGLEPDVPAGELAVGPALRDGVACTARGVRLGDVQLDLAVGGQVAVDLDADLRITRRS